MAATTQGISKSISLDDTRRRIERWRETRSHRHAPMPAVLWDAAVAAAREDGLYPTARALRVDYGALKKHMEAMEPSQARTSPAFVELAPATPPPSGCVIEIEGPRSTMRIRLSALTLGDLIALAHMAWGDAQ